MLHHGDIRFFHIRTYGCQMNELDSENMAGQLMQRGLLPSREEDADIIIFNTCAIRDLAERKVMGKLGQLGRLKKKKAIIGVVGCMAVTKRERLFQKFPHVDFVLGTSNIAQLNEILDEVLLTQRKHVIHVDDTFQEEMDYAITQRDNKVVASIVVSRGCNQFCTYCIVPYTRGKEESVPPSKIEEEARWLVEKQGYKEIVLLGQTVNGYGRDKKEWGITFADLLYQLDKINGLERIRFLTSHPRFFTKELLEAMRDLPSVCEFLHLPMQSGSNAVLRKMNRGYTIEEYCEKISFAKEYVPNISFGTDVIIGFPTETDEDFAKTIEIFEKVMFSVAFIFLFSPRKGTPAMRWKSSISEQEKEERFQRLLFLHVQQAAQERQRYLGEKLEVLFEKRNKNGQLQGRSRCWKKVVAEGGEGFISSIQSVRIHGYNHQTLLGTIIDEKGRGGEVFLA